jgi:hypothetical protein
MISDMRNFNHGLGVSDESPWIILIRKIPRKTQEKYK